MKQNVLWPEEEPCRSKKQFSTNEEYKDPFPEQQLAKKLAELRKRTVEEREAVEKLKTLLRAEKARTAEEEEEEENFEVEKKADRLKERLKEERKKNRMLGERVIKK